VSLCNFADFLERPLELRVIEWSKLPNRGKLTEAKKDCWNGDFSASSWVRVRQVIYTSVKEMARTQPPVHPKQAPTPTARDRAPTARASTAASSSRLTPGGAVPFSRWQYREDGKVPETR
jgi:hypothetical protein